MTLTFDLWTLKPWKPFQQCLLTLWIFVSSFVQIHPPSKEISRHVKYVLTDVQRTDGQTDGQPENITLPLRIVIGGITTVWTPKIYVYANHREQDHHFKKYSSSENAKLDRDEKRMINDEVTGKDNQHSTYQLVRLSHKDKGSNRQLYN